MEHILVISEDIESREIISDLLSKEGYDVTIVRPGYINKSTILKNIYDLLLIDINITEVDGPDFLNEIHSVSPLLPMITISTADDYDRIGKSLKDGARFFLIRPINNEDIFITTIERALESARLNKLIDNYTDSLETEMKLGTSELKKTLEDLKKSYKEQEIAIQKADKANQISTTFLKNINHEIRTPIYGIVSFAELIDSPDCSMEDKEKYLKIIRNNGVRMLNLMSDIIESAKITSGIIELQESEVSLEKLVVNACKDYNHDAKKKNLSLLLQKGDFPDKIIVDSKKLTHTISNLVDNAIKFTNSGTITVSYKKLDQKYLIIIADTGIGISSSKKETIFESFSQGTDKTVEHEGVGLGLSICKAFVEAMQGQIWYESKLGIGTSMFIELPLNIPIEVKEEPVQNIPPPPSDTTLLITDDDESIQLLVGVILKKAGYKIISARNGLEAIEAVKKHPELDLIIMDLKMPVMDGFLATRRIKKIAPDIPVIAHTAYAPELSNEQANSIGFKAVISKPVKAKDFLEIIKKHLE